MASPASASASAWRLSATTILLRRSGAAASSSVSQKTSKEFDYQVLLQKRGNISRSGFFTFPGGVFEESDECLKTTAVRELFEETGILLCNGDCDGEALQSRSKAFRSNIHSNASSFAGVIDTLKASIKYDEVRHFCTFVTPHFEKRRYTTLFFIAEVCEADCKVLEADGLETASLVWMTPAEALAANSSGQMRFLPPQFYVLKELSHLFSVEKVLALVGEVSGLASETLFTKDEARAAIDRRGFPPMQPSPLLELSDDKSVVMGLPFDEHHPEYPGKAGHRHRMICNHPIGVGGYSLQKNIHTRGGIMSGL